jgi:hypothetical protein
LNHYGNRRQFPDSIRAGQQFVAKPGFTFFELERLGPQHDMRKIDIPGVRRNIRTLGHIAHVAQITFVDDLAEVLSIHAIQFTGLPSSIRSNNVGKAVQRFTQRRQP